jgi:colicin import membrane protein
VVEETDGVAEAVQGQLSQSLAVAGQFGERVARLRGEFANRSQARDQQATRELEARFEAERGGARASFASVQEGAWWDVATPKQIADVYESAIVWRDYDDQAKAAIEKIRTEVQDRYDIDVNAPAVDSIQLSDALKDREVELVHERSRAIARDEELTAAQLLMADLVEREAAEFNYEEELGQLPADINFETNWDSPERRTDTLRRMAQRNIEPELAATRMLADADQATHPNNAVRAAVGNAPKARQATSQPVRVQEQPSR